MRCRSIAAAVFLVAGICPPAMAGDCVARFSPEQRQIYSSLSPENQKILTTQKNKDGSPASCEFQQGILEMLANFTPDKRNAGFTQIVNKMLVKEK